jgi:serine/threonine protein kinase
MKKDTEFHPGREDLDELLVLCLSAIEESGMGALDVLCRRHPDSAPMLRRRLDALVRAGLVETGGAVPEPPRRLGEFTLHEPLGGGGMGVVYRAVQSGLGREVALKIVRPEMLDLPGTRARFRREVEAVAHLSHPGLVAVHAVGEEGGVPYLAMERVVGATLAEVLNVLAERDPARLRGNDLAAAVRERARGAPGVDGGAPGHAGSASVFAGSWADACSAVGAAVADALEHAHRAGVLHRDVKPSNVLVGVDGRARLFDFGLALPVEAEDGLTRTGSVVGSLPYMAPEQAEGGAVDRRSDVYGLGATLYELATLRPPFPERNATALRAAILAGDPPSARRWNPALPRDLALVLAKALDRDPSRRYASAAELARDLANVRARRPVAAHPPSVALSLRRWARRRPAVAAALAVGLVAAVGTPTVVAVQERRASARIAEALESARAEGLRAEANLTTALSALSDVLGGIGDDVLRQAPGQREKAAELLLRASTIYGDLLPQRPSDPVLAWNHALLLRQTAEVLDELGREEEGRERNAQAEALLRERLAADPERTALKLDLADCLTDGCDVLARHGEYVEALARYVEVENLLDEILDATAGERMRARALAARRQVRHDVASALCKLGRADEALVEVAAETEDAEAMAAADHPRAHYALLSAQHLHASVLEQLGRDGEAAATYAEVFERCRQSFASSVDTLELDLLTIAATNYATLLFRADRVDEMAPVVAVGVDAIERLAALHPYLSLYHDRFLDLIAPQELALISQERYEEVLPVLERSIRARAELSALRPNDRELQVELAVARHNCANILIDVGRREEAREPSALALESLERLLAAGEERVRVNTAFVRVTHAQARLDLEPPDSDALLALIAERAPNEWRAWSNLAAVLADAATLQTDPAEAERYARAAVGAVERAVDAGYPSRERLLRMKELAALVDRDDFDAALAGLPE